MAGWVFCSLHTDDPKGRDQSTFEISYRPYARAMLPRVDGWLLKGGCYNMAGFYFPMMDGGAGGVASHFAIGDYLDGPGRLIISGMITPHLTIVVGTIPNLTSLAIEERHWWGRADAAPVR